MSEPVIGWTTELFVQKLPGRYAGFHPSKVHFACYGPEPILPVRVTVIADEVAVEDDYWAWWDAEKDYATMIWVKRMLVEMCFPYGSDAETARGRGRIVRVRLEELPTAPAEPGTG